MAMRTQITSLLQPTVPYAYALTSLVSFLTLFILPHSLLTTTLNLLISITIPGWLLIRLRSDRLPLWEALLYSVGLSLCLLLLIGLLLNFSLPLVGISRPLESGIVRWTIWSTVSLLALYSSYNREPSLGQRFVAPHDNSRLMYGLLSIGLLLPLLVVGAANRLNALPDDWLATVTLGIILLYCLGIAWLSFTKRSKRFIPAYLFLISLSLLWMYSLRSNHIFGFDISEEFSYFTHTLQSARWIPSHSPYQACLSITLLPTVLANYTGIAAEAIFKVIYPLLFSLVPTAVYVIGRRFFSSSVTYLGCLFYIFQTSFLFQATALARQEIATLFLAIALVAFFSPRWSLRTRMLLVMVFSLGMITSHYSTTYIAIAGYIATFIVSTIYVAMRSKPQPVFRISGITLAVLVVATIGWNLQITQSSANLSSALRQSFTSIPQIFQAEAQRSAMAQTILGNVGLTGSEATDQYRKRSGYTAAVANIPINGPSNQPQVLSLYFHTFAPTILKLLIISTIVYLLFTRKRPLPLSYRLLAVTMLLLGVLLVVIPSLSLTYNVERLYQQSLLLLAVPAVFVMFRLMSWLRSAGPVVVMIILFSYFMMTSSLIDKLLFNWSNVNIGNANEGYFTFYITDNDRAAAAWLGAHYNNSQVYADRYGALRLKAFSEDVPFSRIKDDLLRGVSASRDYVYLDTTNVVYGRAYFQLNGIVYSYAVPQDEIDTTKNAVYANQKTRVYR